MNITVTCSREGQRDFARFKPATPESLAKLVYNLTRKATRIKGITIIVDEGHNDSPLGNMPNMKEQEQR
jgi:hypothetical protein